MRPRPRTPKAIQEANRRKQQFKDKRFNDPMKIFLERRYPKILAEFGELYKYLDHLNPTKKNLTKSTAFKEWMAANPLPQLLPVHFSAPQLSIPLLSASQLSQLSTPQSSTPQLPTPQLSSGSIQAGADIMGTALSEVFVDAESLNTCEDEPLNPEPEDVGESIVNELLENEVLRELLNEELPEFLVLKILQTKMKE